MLAFTQTGTVGRFHPLTSCRARKATAELGALVTAVDLRGGLKRYFGSKYSPKIIAGKRWRVGDALWH